MDTNIAPKTTPPKPRLRWQPNNKQTQQPEQQKPYRPGDWVKTNTTEQVAIISSRQRDIATDQHTYTLNIIESRIGQRFGQIHAHHSALTLLPNSSITLN